MKTENGKQKTEMKGSLKGMKRTNYNKSKNPKSPQIPEEMFKAGKTHQIQKETR